jgi:uncharacterized protein (UPF0548 family)
VFRLRAPDDATLRAFLDRSAAASLTYEEVGATRDRRPTDGYKRDLYSTSLDRGTFDRAADGLRAWQAHLGAGVDVYPRNAPLAVGTNVIVTARAGPVYASAPCRVVYVIDEPNRFGFAYGTLPGHPERGEEAFIIERAADDVTTFSIVAFSRPAVLATRVGRPVARAIQQRVTHAYLHALQECAAHDRVEVAEPEGEDEEREERDQRGPRACDHPLE